MAVLVYGKRLTLFPFPELTIPTQIWCWVSREWQALRLYGCYVPAWAFILLSVTIYCATGLRTILQAQKALRQVPHKGVGYRAGVLGLPTIVDRVSGPDLCAHPSHKLTRSKKSFISLSDWPMSPLSGEMLLSPGAAEPTGEVSPPVTPPTPAYTPIANSRLSWLGNFGRSPRPAPSPPRHQRLSAKETTGLFINEDPIRRAHLRTGLLFTLSITVTWIPSSVQHVWELIHTNSPFGTKAATAVVLPLHGVLVAAIFFGTSWTVFRECMAERRHANTEMGISGLLEEPGWDNERRSKPGMGQDAKSNQRKLSVWMPWNNNRATKRGQSWDFLDVGIAGGAASTRASRRSRNSGLRTSRLSTAFS